MRRIQTTSSGQPPAMSHTPHSPNGSVCAWTRGCARARASRPTSTPCWQRSSVTGRRVRTPSMRCQPHCATAACTASKPTWTTSSRHWRFPRFERARMTTASLDALDYAPTSFDVLEGGAATTVQSWPGRQGYWNVGVPPSGPMDDLSFRLGNRLLGQRVGRGGPRDRRPGAATEIQFSRHVRDRGTCLRSRSRWCGDLAVVDVRHRARADAAHRTRRGRRPCVPVGGGRRRRPRP